MLGRIALMKFTIVALMASLVLLMACGADVNHFDEKAKIERITALLDAERYDSIIDWYDGNDPLTQAEYRRFYALAQLGKGGFDPIKIIPRILAPQTFSTYERSQLFGRCANVQLKSFDIPEMNCLVVRMINHLPNIEDPHFKEGERTLSEMAKAGLLSEADHTLLLIIETGVVVKRIGNVLESYLRLGERLDEKHLHFFYDEIRRAAISSGEWIEQMQRSPEEVSKRLTGLQKLSILELTGEKASFAQGTGIPYILENINGENRSTRAVFSKMLVIQVIDRVLRDYFYADMD